MRPLALSQELNIGQTRVKSVTCLRIRLFGDFRLSIENRRLPPFATREAQLLFVYLLLHRDRTFVRDVLIDKLFSDQFSTSGRKRLRTAIWRVRSIIEPKGVEPGTYLTVTKQQVGFNAQSSYWLDVQEFESTIAEIDHAVIDRHEPIDNKRLTNAVNLYRGDLLEGSYDEWCVWEQERLKLMLLRALEALMNHGAVNTDWHNAIVRGQQLLSHDPLREHIHRSLMRFYYLIGDRPAALLQYAGCMRLLHDELGIEPMRETTNLYLAIKKECAIEELVDEQTAIRQGTLESFGDESDIDGLSELHESAKQLDDAATHLRRGIDMIELTILRSR